MASSSEKCWNREANIVQLHWATRSLLLVDGIVRTLNDMTLNVMNGYDFQQCIKYGLLYPFKYNFKGSSKHIQKMASWRRSR